jgi:thiamine-phosphate pyrophosphorylase
MRSLADCRLYGFVDAAYLHGRAPESVAADLCRGGVDILQLRAKDLPQEQVRAMAERVLRETRAAGVPLVINDHAELAAQLGAEVCHLGQEDFFDSDRQHVSEVRHGVPGLLVGISSHAPAQAQRAIEAGADYIAIGPVYATGTKPTARPVTLDYVRWAAANVGVPWFAIGGINLQTLPAVLEAGARRVCVVSAILNATDIASECRKYRALLDRL